MGSRRRRRLFLFRPNLGMGGADRVTVTLLEELDRDRFEPHLVLMRARGVLMDQVPSDVVVHDLGAGSLWTAWWPLLRLLRRDPPDVLFSTSSGANVAACLARRLGGGRYRLVLSERNMLMRDQRHARLMLLAKRLAYPVADCVTAVCAAVRDDLQARLGLPAAALRVVYNPVSTPRLAELAAGPCPHPWLEGDEPVILAAGRLVPAKGFDLLLEAFAEVRRRHRARLIILGQGPLDSALGRQADRLGLGSAVDLPGWTDNPFAFMSRCTLFVLSSRYEGLPGVLIQAMACGAPVVASRCPGGSTEIVRSGENGLLFPSDDAGELARRIGELLDDAELRRRLAERGRQSVDRFAVGPVVERYTEALAPATAGAGAGSGR